MELETEKHSLEQAQARVFSDSVKSCCVFFAIFSCCNTPFTAGGFWESKGFFKFP